MCAACKTPSWSGGAGLATAHLTSRAREWEPLVPGKRERRGRHPHPPERRRAPPKQPGALGGAPAPPAAGVRVHTGHAGAPQGEEGAGGVRFGPRGRRVPVARGSGGRSQTLVRGQHERRAGAGGLPNAEGGGQVAGRGPGGRRQREASGRRATAGARLPPLRSAPSGGCSHRPSPLSPCVLGPNPPPPLPSPDRCSGLRSRSLPARGARPGAAPAALAPRPAPGAAPVFSSVHRVADFADSGSAGCPRRAPNVESSAPPGADSER